MGFVLEVAGDFGEFNWVNAVWAHGMETVPTRLGALIGEDGNHACYHTLLGTRGKQEDQGFEFEGFV